MYDEDDEAAALGHQQELESRRRAEDLEYRCRLAAEELDRLLDDAGVRYGKPKHWKSAEEYLRGG